MQANIRIKYTQINQLFLKFLNHINGLSHTQQYREHVDIMAIFCQSNSTFLFFAVFIA